MSTNRKKVLAGVLSIAGYCSPVHCRAVAAQDVVALELTAWRAQHGANWRADRSELTGYTHFLYGGSAEPLFAPASDEDFDKLALAALERSRGLHGVDPATLVHDRTIFLPLGMVGTTDKLSVRFRQELGGVRVVGGWVNVLFDRTGRLLSIDNAALPDVRGGLGDPRIDSAGAAAIATAFFAQEAPGVAVQVGAAELVVCRSTDPSSIAPRLAWRIEVVPTDRTVEAEACAFFIDATSGEALEREALEHHFDVSGRVLIQVTSGLGPYSSSAPVLTTGAPHIYVHGGPAGQVETDANGYFTFVGASPPLLVNVRTWDGRFCLSSQILRDNFSLLPVSSGSQNEVYMSFGPNDYDTPYGNAYYWVNLLRDWVRAVNPLDSTADVRFDIIANLDASSCQEDVNFFINELSFYNPGPCPGGASAPDTAYSTVVLHEAGHVLNHHYGSGNGSDGFGEGTADTFAMYVAGQPIVGQDFYGTGQHWRTGLNTRQFCGDANLGCHGSLHANGEVLMGALWKVRARLVTNYGEFAGAAIANGLLSAWMNGYDDAQIKSVIQTRWLVLDDNDGNLSNGTPRWMEIAGGFSEQGFPQHPVLLPTVYVDAANTTPPWLGVITHPFRTLAEGYQSLAANGALNITAATYDVGPTTLNVSSTLRAIGGVVTLR